MTSIQSHQSPSHPKKLPTHPATMNPTTTLNPSPNLDPNLDHQEAPQNHKDTMEISSVTTHPNSHMTDPIDEEIQNNYESSICPSTTNPQETATSLPTSPASADHDPNHDSPMDSFQLQTSPTSIQIAMPYPYFYQESIWDYYRSSSPTEEDSSTTEEPMQPPDTEALEFIYEDTQFSAFRSQEHGPYVIDGVDIEKAHLMWDFIKNYVEEATAAEIAAAIAAEEERKAMEIKIAEQARIAAEKRRVMEEQKVKRARAAERMRKLRKKVKEEAAEKKQREVEMMRVQMELEAKIARKQAERDALIAIAAREFAERKRNRRSKV